MVTFNQPLWLKLTTIKRNEDLLITMLSGNSLTQMSYPGLIGYVMESSGILELFSIIMLKTQIKRC